MGLIHFLIEKFIFFLIPGIVLLSWVANDPNRKVKQSTGGKRTSGEKQNTEVKVKAQQSNNSESASVSGNTSNKNIPTTLESDDAAPTITA